MKRRAARSAPGATRARDRAEGIASRRLFCYGTLVFPELMRTVSGCLRRPRPATLNGYVRRAFAGEVFPGVVPEPAAAVRGVVYEGLTPAQLRRLDRYEGDYYRRRRVVVQGRDGRALGAWTYVVCPAHRHRLLGADWDERAFAHRYRFSYRRSLRR